MKKNISAFLIASIVCIYSAQAITTTSLHPSELQDSYPYYAYKTHHTYQPEGVHFHSGGQDHHYYPIHQENGLWYYSHFETAPINDHVPIPMEQE